MAVKTKKSTSRSSRAGTMTTKKKTTGPVRTANGQFATTAIKRSKTSGSSSSWNKKSIGAAGASKPPKPVARPAGGSNPKGGKGC